MQSLLFNSFWILLGIIIIEFILSGLWVSGYFKYGIPLYYKKIKTIVKVDNTIQNLENLGISKFIYKEIEPGFIGFRERNFELSFFHYTPLMHGKIIIDETTNEVSIIGLLNYFPIIFIFFIGGFIFDIQNILSGNLFIPVFTIFLLYVLYIIQKRKYDILARYFYIKKNE